MPSTVIDLSHYNPEPDWAGLKAGTVFGVILKATEGTAYIDPTFAGRRERAKRAGFPVCSYHFLKPGSIPQQMLHYLDVVAPERGERVIVDYEDSALTLDELEAAVTALFAAGLDLQVTVYGGSVLKEQMGSVKSTMLSKTSLWLAQYGPGPEWPKGTWPSWTLWQSTDKAVVPGVSAPVDGSVFNGSNENLVKWLSPAAAPAVVVPAKEPHVEISVVTDAGVTVEVWINGKRAA